jgi:FAD-dependent urate hydroxylase
MADDHAVAILGAGPYALATAAYLRDAGVDTCVFGEVMGFWKKMPPDMLLRSYRPASSIGDPAGELTLERFERERGRQVPTPTPLGDFLEYGEWFQRLAVPDVDSRLIRRISRENGGYRLDLADGASLTTSRVVVAAGIGPFASVPPEFADLPSELATHTSVHRSFEQFKGMRVAVVGGGQSALEVSALAAESGAEVETIVRRDGLHFLRGEQLYSRSGALRQLLYPPLGVGPPGLNWVMGIPRLYRLVPSRFQAPLAYRAIRPAGAAWLRPRLSPVRITLGRSVVAVDTEASSVRLRLDSGEERTVDHIIFGTGYRVDVRRYSFLDEDLLAGIQVTSGFPKLSAAFESSAPGLYFVGAPAAASAGPGMRFVSHTGAAAASLTSSVRNEPRRRQVR